MQSQAGPEYRNPSPIFQLLRHNIQIIIFLLIAISGMVAILVYFNPETAGITLGSIDETESQDEQDPSYLVAAINKPLVPRPVSQRITQSPAPIRIGLIAGHRESDSGTSCEDGLTEVQITNAVAEKVKNQLQLAGISSETLDEFDSRLVGYRSTGLVSIHVDSCDFINDLATGFKIAGSPYTDSSKLSICLEQAYGDKSQLPYHPNSITPHMENYHAFDKISSGTPAIIIEIGFLNLDREILTVGSDIVVDGLTEGILCFLDRTG